MPSVFLVRHGQASFGGSDYDVLSELGARQAEAAHAEIVRRGVVDGRLVSGTMRRQLDTARAWSRSGDELELDARWNEYDATDILRAHSSAAVSLEKPTGAAGEALTPREFQSILDDALLGWVAAGSAGRAPEVWTSFRDRALAALQALTAQLASGESATVFTSGGIISALAVQLLGLPDSAMVSFNHVAINAAITKIVSGRRGLSLVSFNEHGHLEADHLITYR